MILISRSVVAGIALSEGHNGNGSLMFDSSGAIVDDTPGVVPTASSSEVGRVDDTPGVVPTGDEDSARLVHEEEPIEDDEDQGSPFSLMTDDEDEDVEDDDGCVPRRGGVPRSGSWSNAVAYPLGRKDMSNEASYKAAKQLFPELEGIDILELHAFRTKYQAKCLASPLTAQQYLGQRLLEHYSKDTKTFGKTFVVGNKACISAAAYSLCAGVSNVLFEKAQTDVRKGRNDMGAGPYNARKIMPTSAARSHLEAYVITIRKNMQGRPERDLKWTTHKLPLDERWRTYKNMMTDANLDVRLPAHTCIHARERQSNIH